MTIRQQVVKQFRQPSGMLGQLAGFIMSSRPSNRVRNHWTLELLDLQANDRLLEIGFGPGLALEEAARAVTRGTIVGIDHSQVMLRQASKRNAAAIEQGRVKLYLGSLENLPPHDEPFTKIYSANVVQFWQDPVAEFSKLRAMLVPGGVVASTYMPRNQRATIADAHNKAGEILDQMHQAGFRNIEIRVLPLEPVPAISVVAVHE